MSEKHNEGALEKFSEKFSKLCDLLWRVQNPDTPEDGCQHTSRDCRAWAKQIYEILEIPHPQREEVARMAEKHSVTKRSVHQ